MRVRGNAVNYIVRQECPALAIGAARIAHLARPAEDIARLTEKGVMVYALQDDVEERGIDEKACIPGIKLIRRNDVAGLMEEHEQVWHL